MPTLSPPGRARDLAYIKHRALGISIRRAAMAAGFSPHGSYRVERRLAREVERERAKLAGIARRDGRLPHILPKSGTQRVLVDLAADG